MKRERRAVVAGRRKEGRQRRVEGMVQTSGGKWKERGAGSKASRELRKGKVAEDLMEGGAGRQADCAQLRARLRVGETEE